MKHGLITCISKPFMSLFAPYLCWQLYKHFVLVSQFPLFWAAAKECCQAVFRVIFHFLMVKSTVLVFMFQMLTGSTEFTYETVILYRELMPCVSVWQSHLLRATQNTSYWYRETELNRPPMLVCWDWTIAPFPWWEFGPVLFSVTHFIPTEMQ